MACRTLTCHHVRNLNDRVNVCLWEDTLASRTLDIEAENTKGSDFRPLPVRCMGYELVPSDDAMST